MYYYYTQKMASLDLLIYYTKCKLVCLQREKLSTIYFIFHATNFSGYACISIYINNNIFPQRMSTYRREYYIFKLISNCTLIQRLVIYFLLTNLFLWNDIYLLLLYIIYFLYNVLTFNYMLQPLIHW